MDAELIAIKSEEIVNEKKKIADLEQLS